MSSKKYASVTKQLFVNEKRSSSKPTQKFSNVSSPPSHAIKFEEKPTSKKYLMYQPEPMEIQVSSYHGHEKYQVAENQEIQTFFSYDDAMFGYKKMSHVRINRGRLYDWFVEIIHSYKQSWQTLWGAIAILDRLIVEKGKITTQNIHLYGSACLFMSSKYHEPRDNDISFYYLYQLITHKKFSKKQLLECEAEIFKWICLSQNNKSMHFPTMEDRVMQCFPDANDQMVKKIMIELFFCFQEPNMLAHQVGNITETQLVKEVGNAVFSGQRYETCCEIEKYFLDIHNCRNIRNFGLEMKL